MLSAWTRRYEESQRRNNKNTREEEDCNNISQNIKNSKKNGQTGKEVYKKQLSHNTKRERNYEELCT